MSAIYGNNTHITNVIICGHYVLWHSAVLYW